MASAEPIKLGTVLLASFTVVAFAGSLSAAGSLESRLTDGSRVGFLDIVIFQKSGNCGQEIWEEISIPEYFTGHVMCRVNSVGAYGVLKLTCQIGPMPSRLI